MASGKQIGELERQTSFEPSDLLLVEREGITKSATIDALKQIMKGEQGVPGKDGTTIDDNIIALSTVWSSKKTSMEISHILDKLQYIPDEYIISLFNNTPTKNIEGAVNDLLSRQGLDTLVSEVKGAINVVDTRVQNISEDLYTTKVPNRHTTDNGVVEFNSLQEGYINEVNITGNTVVVAASMQSKRADPATNDAIRVRFNTDANVASTFNYRITDATYTLYNFTDKVIGFPQINRGGTWGQRIDVQPHSCRTVTVALDNSIPGVDFWYRDGWTSSDLDSITNEMFMVLEGTQPFMSHISGSGIDGLYSVGQFDDIKVISQDNDSRVDLSSITFTEGQHVSSTTGEPDSSSGLFKYSNEYIEVEPGAEYLFKNINLQFAMYREDKTVVPQMWESLRTLQVVRNNMQSIFHYVFPQEVRFIRINIPTSNPLPFSLHKNCKYSVKRLSNTLRSTPYVRDQLFRCGDKHYKLQKCAEKTLSSSDTIVSGGSNGDLLLFRIEIPGMTLHRVNMKCNKFRVSGSYTRDECIFGEDTASIGSHVYVSILASRLATPDVTGFASWLDKNRVTITYELSIHRFSEVGDVSVSIPQGNVSVQLFAGYIPTEFTFTTTNTLHDELHIMKQQIEQLTSVINMIAFSNDPHMSPKLTLTNVDDVLGEGAAIVFDNVYRDQSVQIRQNHWDSEKKPYGLRVEKGVSNAQRHMKAYLDVEGLIYTEEGIVIGCSKTPPTGATHIRSESQLSGVNAISFYPVHQYGHGVRVGAGGLTVVGGGESAEKYVKELPDGGTLDIENAIITADNDIIIRSGCQTEFTEDRKSVFHRNGGLSVGTSAGNVKKTTISYAQPSGGSGGDIWLTY